jgi:hypothetical protein
MTSKVRQSEDAVANGERHDAVSIVVETAIDFPSLTPLEETAPVVLEDNEPSTGRQESSLRNRRSKANST